MLVLYIFVPAAALVFLLMAIASIPKEAITAAKTFIADHLLLYRATLVVFALSLCSLHEIFLLFFGGWMALACIGLTVRHWLLGGRKKKNEEAIYGTSPLPLEVFELLWRGR